MAEQPVVVIEPHHVAMWAKAAVWTFDWWAGRNPGVLPKVGKQ